MTGLGLPRLPEGRAAGLFSGLRGNHSRGCSKSFGLRGVDTERRACVTPFISQSVVLLIDSCRWQSIHRDVRMVAGGQEELTATSGLRLPLHYSFWRRSTPRSCLGREPN